MPLILKLMSSSAVVQRPGEAQQSAFCVFLYFSRIQPQPLSPFIRHIGTSASVILWIESFTSIVSFKPPPSSPLLSDPPHFVCTSAHDLFPCCWSLTFSPFRHCFQFCHPFKIKLPVFSLNCFPLCITVSVNVDFILLSLQPYSKSWQMFSVKGQIGNTLGVTGYVHSVTTTQLRETWMRIPSLLRTGCWIFWQVLCEAPSWFWEYFAWAGTCQTQGS